MIINYRNINLEESETVFLMLKRAAEWLKDVGLDYWQDWHNPPQNFREWIIDGLIRKEFYFAENYQGLIGMFRLQYSDELFWGKSTDLSGYIHSFTTVREHKGKGFGRIILKDIENTLIQKGVNYLRLDCSSKIKGLCEYYKSCGFKDVGKKELFGDILTLFEKRIIN